MVVPTSSSSGNGSQQNQQNQQQHQQQNYTRSEWSSLSIRDRIMAMNATLDDVVEEEEQEDVHSPPNVAGATDTGSAAAHAGVTTTKSGSTKNSLSLDMTFSDETMPSSGIISTSRSATSGDTATASSSNNKHQQPQPQPQQVDTSNNNNVMLPPQISSTACSPTSHTRTPSVISNASSNGGRASVVDIWRRRESESPKVTTTKKIPDNNAGETPLGEMRRRKIVNNEFSFSRSSAGTGGGSTSRCSTFQERLQQQQQKTINGSSSHSHSATSFGGGTIQTTKEEEEEEDLVAAGVADCCDTVDEKKEEDIDIISESNKNTIMQQQQQPSSTSVWDMWSQRVATANISNSGVSRSCTKPKTPIVPAVNRQPSSQSRISPSLPAAPPFASEDEEETADLTILPGRDAAAEADVATTRNKTIPKRSRVTDIWAKRGLNTVGSTSPTRRSENESTTNDHNNDTPSEVAPAAANTAAAQQSSSAAATTNLPPSPLPTTTKRSSVVDIWQTRASPRKEEEGKSTISSSSPGAAARSPALQTNSFPDTPTGSAFSFKSRNSPLHHHNNEQQAEEDNDGDETSSAAPADSNPATASIAVESPRPPKYTAVADRWRNRNNDSLTVSDHSENYNTTSTSVATASSSSNKLRRSSPQYRTAVEENSNASDSDVPAIVVDSPKPPKYNSVADRWRRSCNNTSDVIVGQLDDPEPHQSDVSVVGTSSNISSPVTRNSPSPVPARKTTASARWGQQTISAAETQPPPPREVQQPLVVKTRGNVAARWTQRINGTSAPIESESNNCKTPVPSSSPVVTHSPISLRDSRHNDDEIGDELTATTEAGISRQSPIQIPPPSPSSRLTPPLGQGRNAAAGTWNRQSPNHVPPPSPKQTHTQLRARGSVAGRWIHNVTASTSANNTPTTTTGSSNQTTAIAVVSSELPQKSTSPVPQVARTLDHDPVQTSSTAADAAPSTFTEFRQGPHNAEPSLPDTPTRLRTRGSVANRWRQQIVNEPESNTPSKEETVTPRNTESDAASKADDSLSALNNHTEKDTHNSPRVEFLNKIGNFDAANHLETNPLPQVDKSSQAFSEECLVKPPPSIQKQPPPVIEPNKKAEDRTHTPKKLKFSKLSPGRRGMTSMLTRASTLSSLVSQKHPSSAGKLSDWSSSEGSTFLYPPKHRAALKVDRIPKSGSAVSDQYPLLGTTSDAKTLESEGSLNPEDEHLLGAASGTKTFESDSEAGEGRDNISKPSKMTAKTVTPARLPKPTKFWKKTEGSKRNSSAKKSSGLALNSSISSAFDVWNGVQDESSTTSSKDAPLKKVNPIAPDDESTTFNFPPSPSKKVVASNTMNNLLSSSTKKPTTKKEQPSKATVPPVDISLSDIAEALSGDTAGSGAVSPRSRELHSKKKGIQAHRRKMKFKKEVTLDSDLSEFVKTIEAECNSGPASNSQVDYYNSDEVDENSPTRRRIIGGNPGDSSTEYTPFQVTDTDCNCLHSPRPLVLLNDKTKPVSPEASASETNFTFLSESNSGASSAQLSSVLSGTSSLTNRAERLLQKRRKQGRGGKLSSPTKDKASIASSYREPGESVASQSRDFTYSQSTLSGATSSMPLNKEPIHNTDELRLSNRYNTASRFIDHSQKLASACLPVMPVQQEGSLEQSFAGSTVESSLQSQSMAGTATSTASQLSENSRARQIKRGTDPNESLPLTGIASDKFLSAQAANFDAFQQACKGFNIRDIAADWAGEMDILNMQKIASRVNDRFKCVSDKAHTCAALRPYEEDGEEEDVAIEIEFLEEDSELIGEDEEEDLLGDDDGLCGPREDAKQNSGADRCNFAAQCESFDRPASPENADKRSAYV